MESLESRPVPSSLSIDSRVVDNGLVVSVNDDDFPIGYPAEIWSSYQGKEILQDTITLASTYYVPQIVGVPEVHYGTARPLAECFLYYNGIYDAPYCAEVDDVSSMGYLRDFFNTRYRFRSETIKTPPKIDFSPSQRKRALILFSLGKESLLNFALCRELGIEPILVTIAHPGHRFEHLHKGPLVREFEKEMNTKVHVVEYTPGWLKEGKWWNKKTELGWGLHVTEYSLLALPFIEHFNIDLVITGNEQSCNDTYIDEEGVLIFRAGLDQHRDWTHQHSLLLSLMAGRRIEVVSLVEPLYEIAETKILHTRYKDIGRYQMSCFAADERAKNSRWCQHCEKCAYMYALLRAANVSPTTVGFTEDLFSEDYSFLYDTFLNRSESSHYYGSQGELALAFYLALQNGATGFSITRFERELLPRIQSQMDAFSREYMGIHETKSMPKEINEKVGDIYSEALG